RVAAALAPHSPAPTITIADMSVDPDEHGARVVDLDRVGT
ncbi:MAG: hypothetical protein QOJ95_4260, partial [Mycobacterium sp.]|nr:hypothetical protein [Mycobacterium sp.]